SLTWSTPRRAMRPVRLQSLSSSLSTTETLMSLCWPYHYSTSVSKTADTLSTFKLAPRNSSTNLSDGFLNAHRYDRIGCRAKSWKRLKNGGVQYVRPQDTRTTWGLSGTCTGYCCTRAICSRKYGWK